MSCQQRERVSERKVLQAEGNTHWVIETYLTCFVIWRDVSWVSRKSKGVGIKKDIQKVKLEWMIEGLVIQRKDVSIYSEANRKL